MTVLEGLWVPRDKARGPDQMSGAQIRSEPASPQILLSPEVANLSAKLLEAQIALLGEFQEFGWQWLNCAEAYLDFEHATRLAVARTAMDALALATTQGGSAASSRCPIADPSHSADMQGWPNDCPLMNRVPPPIYRRKYKNILPPR